MNLKNLMSIIIGTASIFFFSAPSEACLELGSTRKVQLTRLTAQAGGNQTRETKSEYSPPPGEVIVDFKWERERGYRDGTPFTRFTGGPINVATSTTIKNIFEQKINALVNDGQNEYKARFENLERDLRSSADRFSSDRAILIYGVRVQGPGLLGGERSTGASGHVVLKCLGTAESIEAYLDRQLSQLPKGNKTISEGVFKFEGRDPIYYSNGEGAYCWYQSWEDFIGMTGGVTPRSQPGRLSEYSMKYDGICGGPTGSFPGPHPDPNF